MKNIVFILLVFSFLHSLSFERYDSNFYHANELSTYQSAYSPSEVIGSLLIPGWGQFSRGYNKKAYIFLCIEAAAFGSYYYFNKQGIDIEASTKGFGDDHWTFYHWVNNYYDFSPGGQYGAHSYLFENENGGVYKELWEGGHKIEFTYDDRYYTTGAGFEEFYNDVLCPDGPGECNQQIFTLIEVKKDHHYYENIGKYDHFFSGWDDSENIYGFRKSSGELIAMSPNKKKYRSDWEAAAEFNRIADYAVYAVYVNHIVSLIDLLVFSRINKNSKFKYQIDTIYNPNNIMGVGEVVFSISW